MRESTIRKLVKLVESSEIESLNIKTLFSNVTIVKRSATVTNGNGGHSNTITIPKAQVVSTLPPLEPAVAPNPGPQAAAPTPQPAVAPPPVAAPAGKEIKSPMVGTFYTSPEPGAPPFVDVGQRVTKGQTVCIIEAMKLMNEIEAEFDGVVIQRFVENAQPVEFGQILFLVQPA
jgi:acetyl-CoA carboxylase biotin carboxyl carrier protein